MSYARGEFARVPFAWNDQARRLTIGVRSGRFAGMAARRTITVVLHDGAAAGPVFEREEGRTVTYTGKPLSLRL